MMKTLRIAFDKASACLGNFFLAGFILMLLYIFIFHEDGRLYIAKFALALLLIIGGSSIGVSMSFHYKRYTLGLFVVASSISVGLFVLTNMMAESWSWVEIAIGAIVGIAIGIWLRPKHLSWLREYQVFKANKSPDELEKLERQRTDGAIEGSKRGAIGAVIGSIVMVIFAQLSGFYTFYEVLIAGISTLLLTLAFISWKEERLQAQKVKKSPDDQLL